MPVTVWGQFAESLPLLGGADKATVVARVLTVVYFLFFLLMPWYTARDKTKPVPERVTMMNNENARHFSPLLFAGRLRRARSRAGGADLRLDPAPVHRLDAESLQRGARNFVNYCLNCHSGEVHALQAADGPRPRPAEDQGQPDVRHRQDRRAR